MILIVTIISLMTVIAIAVAHSYGNFDESRNDGDFQNMPHLNFRTTDTHVLTLKAVDKGTPPKSAELTITVKVVAAATAPPSFQDRNYKGTMKDNTLSGQQIGEVTVTIPESLKNKYIQYQIIAGNADNSFCIDYRKSAYAQKSFDFDTWKKLSFELTIALVYGSSMSATEMWATIPKDNDNAPVFVGGSKPVVKVLPEDTGR